MAPRPERRGERGIQGVQPLSWRIQRHEAHEMTLRVVEQNPLVRRPRPLGTADHVLIRGRVQRGEVEPGFQREVVCTQVAESGVGDFEMFRQRDMIEVVDGTDVVKLECVVDQPRHDADTAVENAIVLTADVSPVHIPSPPAHEPGRRGDTRRRHDHRRALPCVVRAGDRCNLRRAQPA